MTTAAAPPHDLASEQAVLGAVLLSPRLLEPLLTETGLRPQHFYRPQHATVFGAMAALLDQQEPVDTLTVTNHLKVTGRLDAAGGPVAIDHLTADAPVTGNASAYARRVIDDAMWRDRIRASHEALQACAGRDEDAYNAATRITDNTGRPDDTSADPAKLAEEWLDWYQDTGQDSIKLPWPSLSRQLPGGGLTPGNTTIVAGWSSMGKSSAVDQILEHAHSQGAGCWAYINEMGREERATRTLAALTGIPAHRIFDRSLSAAEFAQVSSFLDDLPFGITDVAGLPCEDIARLIRARRSDLAVIDLVTLIPASETRDWDQVSKTLTVAARQSGTHLMLVSQLNNLRATSSTLPPPVRRDLRNTGSWFNDAANVLFVHRDQDFDTESEIAVTLDTGHLRFDKIRNGRPGAVSVLFDDRTLRFKERPYE